MATALAPRLLRAALLPPLLAACARATQTGAPDADLGDALPPRVLLEVRGLEAERGVDVAFRVTRGAYVMVVAVGADGEPRVLYPERPADMGYATGGRTPLPRLRADPRARARLVVPASGAPARAPREIVLAVASDEPLQLDRVGIDDGVWSRRVIEGAISGASPAEGAMLLAMLLSVPGQRVSVDLAYTDLASAMADASATSSCPVAGTRTAVGSGITMECGVGRRTPTRRP